MSSQSITTISLCLFGRISSLLVSDDVFVERFITRKSMLELDSNDDLSVNKKTAIDFKKLIFSSLLDELILLVESVVLSDSINVYCGQSVSENMPGWESFLIFREEANEAFSLINGADT